MTGNSAAPDLFARTEERKLMGAAPERRTPAEEQTGQALGPSSANDMATSEPPKISLVTTTRKAPSWNRLLFNLDSSFRGLMLLAALSVLAVVGLIVAELLQRSALAW